MNSIDWLSKQSYIFLNSRAMPQYEINIQEIIEKYDLSEHVFLATSGSTALDPSDLKLVALNKQAILNCAASVNKHLEISSNDIIMNPLPIFHIGGLATYARAYLSAAKLIDCSQYQTKWDAPEFVSLLECKQITITSLVPTQIYDIVIRKLCAPKYLRAVIVGGGSLSFAVYQAAKKLNWPILLSYGMSETASQIATSEMKTVWENFDEFPKLKILSHMQVYLNNENRIILQGNSLCTGYIKFEKKRNYFVDPKIKTEIAGQLLSCLLTSDLGYIQGQYLQIIGRSDDVVKISGESVSLNKLEHLFNDILLKHNFNNKAAIISEFDVRLQNIIAVVLENKNSNLKNDVIANLILEFNNRVYPFERIKKLYFIDHLPKTALGKLKKKQLSACIGEGIYIAN